MKYVCNIPQIQKKSLNQIFIYKCNTNRSKFTPDFKIIKDLKKRFSNNLPKLNTFIIREFTYFKQNTDEKSKKILDLVMGSILVSINCNKLHHSPSKLQNIIHDEFQRELPSIKKRFKVQTYVSEVFWSHHGLRNENQQILDYIRERDILDIGAFCGDSLIVLLQYTNKTVYSYEYSPSNINMIEKAIEDNNLNKNHFKIINKGIGNEITTIKTSFKRSKQSKISNNNKNGCEINLTTIDHEVEKYNMNVGFMKADIEGMELQALEGAVKTIEKQRPIISFSIYHNFNDLFKVRHFLDQFPNYSFKYKIGTYSQHSFGELIIFGYPKEIVT